ncbi:MAG: NUDIX domain-containing protein [Mycobacterium sp.]|uniref:NUDIX domain-containing protein n=1 Tax=Mycobacterium sp. TaxID=1785 RepID=UPI001EC1EC13|nr:NUDIX domain-containing protein [Mycobacterium sp.]MBW0018863.1 NUDIX domain-containing protein [Mycobacterium sp.]
MRGDGDGWVKAANGNRFWGRYGAAGLLLRAPAGDGRTAVLLQRRAIWSHQGGTWGLPGGARDSHESAEAAAIREAREETGVRLDQITVRATVVTAAPAGTGWTYVTVIADADELLPVVPCPESADLSWIVEGDVADLRLHPGLAASWQRLRSLQTVMACRSYC